MAKLDYCNTVHYHKAAYCFEHTAVALNADGVALQRITAFFGRMDDGQRTCCIIQNDALYSSISLEAEGKKGGRNRAFILALENYNKGPWGGMKAVYRFPLSRQSEPLDGESNPWLAAAEGVKFEDDEDCDPEDHFEGNIRNWVNRDETLKQAVKKLAPNCAMVYVYGAGKSYLDW